jgi:uncharacterized protein YqgC (DUF456 family)
MGSGAVYSAASANPEARDGRRRRLQTQRSRPVLECGMSTETVWLVLAVVLVCVGIAGSVLPALPGVPLVFAGLLLAAWAGDFQQVTWVTLVVLGLLTVISFVIDFVATAAGARRVGATKLAVVGAALGTLCGLFLGLPGVILGPFVGAVAGELISHGKVQQAARAGLATWLGLIFGTLTKLALVFTMLGVFTLAYFF